MRGGDFLDKAEAIKSLYSQRERFILIGLTGRTGSGCTTVSDILAKKSMEELDLRSYKTRDYKSADERKYSVIYRYMKEGDKWKSFTVIEASSVIFSFVLEGTYGMLFDFIDTIAQKGEIKDKELLKVKIVKALNKDYDDMGSFITRIYKYELSNNLFDEVMHNINEELEKDEISRKKDGKCYAYCFGRKGNPKMILFQGAIGNAYISLYAPRMPYKDEIELTTGVSVKEVSRQVYEKHKDDK